MPGAVFWVVLAVGAIALSVWSQSYIPPLVWGLLCSAYYLVRVKASGFSVGALVAVFTVIALTGLASFIHLTLYYLTTI